MPDAMALEAKPIKPSYSATGSRQVWLTFDDGPHPRYTPKVLSILAAHKARATFFLVGRNAALYPEIVKRILKEGHAVANHTWTHPNLSKLTAAQIKAEIKKTEDVIRTAMGKRRLFRPPYGAHDAEVDTVVAAMDYRMILWNVDTVDWSKDYKPDLWVEHGVKQIKGRASSVVLNHDIHKTTADNLDTFLRKIRAIKGATFAPPDKL